METDVREDMLFCNPIECNTANGVFNIIDNFFNENDILWENYAGLCTDGAPAMAGKNAGLQAAFFPAIVRKVAPRAV